MKPELKVLVFGNKTLRNRFSLSQRITNENGLTTIRPIRNGVPGGTEAELEEAFENFRLMIDNMWKPKSQKEFT